MTTATTLRRSAAVEVHLVTGATLEGRVEDFSPTGEELALRSGADRRSERAENVAWISFQREDGVALSFPPGAETFCVQVAGGPKLTVRARPDDVKSEPGFFAVLMDAEEARAEVFIYAHGVNSAERELPLAASLAAEGLLDTEAASRPATVGDGKKKPIAVVLSELKRSERPAIDEAVLAQRRKKMRLGDVLVEAAYVTQAEIELALAEQKRRPGKRLGEVLVEVGILSELDLARALSTKFQIPLIDLDTVELNPAALHVVPREIMSKYGVLPLDIDANVLTVGIADPMVTDAIDLLRFQSRLSILVVLVADSQLKRSVAELLREPGAAQKTQAIRLSALNAVAGSRPGASETIVDPSRDPDGIVRLLNQLVLAADQRGASDIHIEPHGDDRPTKVRFRIDGRCVAAQEIAGKNRSALAVRLKVMANLDIAERRRPQDGKLRVTAPDGRSIDIRLTTIPTVDDNEDFVLRLLLGSRALGFDDLLLSAKNADTIRAWLKLDHGLVLCVGPTGVGKTTTVHAMLSLLDTAELKVWTAEDPVEIVNSGLRQLHVQPKIDVTFAAALRSFLRADPDVIMIGEMRDLETAALAVEASLTGHLVLSTLHTKSAVDTIARLLAMGLEPFTVADALSGILSQRLVRRLCAGCKTSERASDEELASLERLVGAELLGRVRAANGDPPRLWSGAGCEACGHTGYAGRVAIHEVLTVTDALRPHIGRRAAAEELRRVVGDAMVGMREDGLLKAFAGHTDVREVLAVT
ncbi:MAG: Flp pilus assembly complex ATPase component TadA [Deltaproteobacteria bacterium]|nr:Flp pilus assembly complex ATPase component TadA [Deltaproteobacteria bacterium]